MVEEFKPVVGFSKYLVVNTGKVYSLYTNKFLQPYHNIKSGRSQVVLTEKFTTYTRGVHVLVLEAFVGPCPNGLEGCHNDGDFTNNDLTNLRWDTRESNMNDKITHGTNWQLNKTHCPNNHEYNLANTIVRRNSRECKACTRASDYIRKTNPSANFAEIADRKYKEIMSVPKKARVSRM